MKITDIQAQQRNQNRYSLFVDGKFSFSLSLEEIQDSSLRIGTELSGADVDRFQKLSIDSKHYESAFIKSLRRPHSLQEMRLHLRKRGAEPEVAESIINRLVSKHYLDDARFVQFWFEMRSKSNKSKKYIISELKAKGVSEEVINSNMPSTDDYSSLQSLIAQKTKRYPDTNKLMQYLMRKGFSYDDIQSAMRKED